MTRGGPMTVLQQDAGIARPDATTDVVIPAAGTPPGASGSMSDGLTRRVRVRSRGEVTLLDAVSFTLSAGGALVAIVGPSGAGKTTLLEAIAGICGDRRGRCDTTASTCPRNLRDVPQRARLRASGRHHPCRPAAPTDAPLRGTLRYAATTAPVVGDRGGGRRRVADAINAVGLTEQTDVRVGSLTAVGSASAARTSPSSCSPIHTSSSSTSRRRASTRSRALS